MLMSFMVLSVLGEQHLDYTRLSQASESDMFGIISVAFLRTPQERFSARAVCALEPFGHIRGPFGATTGDARSSSGHRPGTQSSYRARAAPHNAAECQQCRHQEALN